jgi:hypothetical protein
LSENHGLDAGDLYIPAACAIFASVLEKHQMKQIIIIQKSVIYFRRWSRKGYAAFCSLGRCVSVRQLGKNVAEASLKKQQPYTVIRIAGGFEVETDDPEYLHLPEIFPAWSSMPATDAEVCGREELLPYKSETGKSRSGCSSVRIQTGFFVRCRPNSHAASEHNHFN